MTTSAELRDLAIRHGLGKKRNNAIVAVLSGALPGLLLGYYLSPHWKCWVGGVTIGLLWGNAFEYAYHRWLLHRPRSSFGRGHLQHHMHVGAPDEPEHVSLGRHPYHIALLFAGNGIAVMGLDLLFGFKVAPGIFVGWTVYLVLAEEIHWRIHMDCWLPPGLRFARAYHMSHHEIPNTRYNVFLPFCDFLFGNTAFAMNVTATQPLTQGAALPVSSQSHSERLPQAEEAPS